MCAHIVPADKTR